MEEHVWAQHRTQNNFIKKHLCDVCQKKLKIFTPWNICQVCRLKCHVNCITRANTELCSKRLQNIIPTISPSKRSCSFNFLISKISTEKKITVHLVDSFLPLVSQYPSTLDIECYEDHFEMFRGIEIEERTHSALDKQLHFYDNSFDNKPISFFEYMEMWLSNGKNEEKFATSKLLKVLLEDETNKKKFLSNPSSQGIVNIIFKNNAERNSLEPSPEELKLSIIFLKIFRNISESTGDERDAIKRKSENKNMIPTQIVEKIVYFLRDCKKFDGTGKKVKFSVVFKVKENRDLLKEVRREGAYFVYDYYQCFYDKDEAMTHFLCDIYALDLIVEGAAKSLINIYPQIDTSKLNFEGAIYSSPLCKVYSGALEGYSEKVAIKLLSPTKAGFTPENFRKEITIFSLIKHPNVCPFVGASEGIIVDDMDENYPKEDFPLIIMPHYKRGSVAEYLHSIKPHLRSPVIPIGTLINMAMHMANGLYFLHSRKFIHRDIKPGNFLIDDSFVVKLCDFGVSRALPDASDGMTCIGTEIFMAPEVYGLQPYNAKADIYSFGLVLWCMVTGNTTPYSKFSTVVDFVNHVLTNELFREPIPDTIPYKLQNLIEMCWHPEPDKRPDVTTVLAILHDMDYTYDDEGHRLHYTHPYDNLKKLHPTLYNAFMRSMFHYLDKRSSQALAVTCKSFYEFTRGGAVLSPLKTSPRIPIKDAKKHKSSTSPRRSTPRRKEPDSESKEPKEKK